MEETQKTVARCENCGNIYSVRIQEDGTVYPIGNAGSCDCGSTEFTVLDADNLGDSAP